MARTIETGQGQGREWADHKKRRDILWQAFLHSYPGTKEREEAADAYLAESDAYWKAVSVAQQDIS